VGVSAVLRKWNSPLGWLGTDTGRDGAAAVTGVGAGVRRLVLALHPSAGEPHRHDRVEAHQELGAVALVEDRAEAVAPQDPAAQPAALDEHAHLVAGVLGAPQQRAHAEHRAGDPGHPFHPPQVMTGT
jgi:hypothetical protein